MDRLPDSILESILGEITNAEELLACSSVSKRFASLISHSRTTLSVQIPDSWVGERNMSVKMFLESFRHFIKQFGCIGILSLQLPLLVVPVYREYPFDNFEHPFVKWEFHFEFPNSVHHGLFLSAKGFSLIDDEIEEEDGNNSISDEDMNNFKRSVDSYITDLAMTWHSLEPSLLKFDVGIQKTVITESTGQGRMEFVRLDGPLFEPHETGMHLSYSLNYKMSYTMYWYLPVLKLPSGKGVMKGVKLGFIQAGDDGGSLGPYGGKEMKVQEAAKKIDLVWPSGRVCTKDFNLQETAKKIMESPPHSSDRCSHIRFEQESAYAPALRALFH